MEVNNTRLNETAFEGAVKSDNLELLKYLLTVAPLTSSTTTSTSFSFSFPSSFTYQYFLRWALEAHALECFKFLKSLYDSDHSQGWHRLPNPSVINSDDATASAENATAFFLSEDFIYVLENYRRTKLDFIRYLVHYKYPYPSNTECIALSLNYANQDDFALFGYLVNAGIIGVTASNRKICMEHPAMVYFENARRTLVELLDEYGFPLEA